MTDEIFFQLSYIENRGDSALAISHRHKDLSFNGICRCSVQLYPLGLCIWLYDIYKCIACSYNCCWPVARTTFFFLPIDLHTAYDGDICIYIIRIIP